MTVVTSILLCIVICCNYVKARGSKGFFSPSFELPTSSSNDRRSLLDPHIPDESDQLDDELSRFTLPKSLVSDKIRFSKTEIDPAAMQWHGTTTLAFKFQDKIVVCVDSKASSGDYVASTTVKKVIPVSKTIVATMAGGAADCSFWIRKVAAELQKVAAIYKTEITVRSFATLLANTIANQPQLSIGTMVAGVDGLHGPTLYYVDNSGACVEGDIFCVGSGSPVAYSALDSALSRNELKSHGNFPKPNGETPIIQDLGKSDIHVAKAVSGALASHLTLEEAVNRALWAVRQATYRDGFSGGYINVFVISADGVRHLQRVDCRLLDLTNSNGSAK